MITKVECYIVDFGFHTWRHAGCHNPPMHYKFKFEIMVIVYCAHYTSVGHI
jgi:hypothetical protein